MENSQNVSVIYSWTAKEGKLDELTQIYKDVISQMKETETGALAAEFFVDSENNSILVRDLFADAGAVGFHLSETAGKHFGGLLEIATPGTFYFGGDVPDEIKQAISGMQLNAQYSQLASGFAR